MAEDYPRDLVAYWVYEIKNKDGTYRYGEVWIHPWYGIFMFCLHKLGEVV